MGSAGKADMDDHPYCYLQLDAEVLYTSSTGTWVGEKFLTAHVEEGLRSLNAHKKSIVPTKNIFHIALHMHGACKLEPRWTGCNEASSSDVTTKGRVRDNSTIGKDGFCHTEIKSRKDFRRNRHAFNELLLSKDAKMLNKSTHAVIYHIGWFGRELSSVRNSSNDYAAKFYPRVKEALAARQLGSYF
jgi:hypothetical protein